MEVKQLVKEAKNGSKEAIKLLENHYLDIFKNNVIRFCGEEYVDEAMYDYSYLIEDYLKSNHVECLENFLRRKSKLYPKEKFVKRQIGDKIDFNNEDELNFIINHYTDSFYEKIKDFSDILGEDELYVYALNLIKYFVFATNINGDIRVLLNVRIFKELDLYKNNKELIIKKFILMNGYTDKIIEYYSKKYEYILENHNGNYGYNFIKKEYLFIIENAIKKLINSSTAIDTLIEKTISMRIYEEKQKEKKYILNIRNNKYESNDLLFNNYIYLIKIIYEKYKNDINIENNEIKQILLEKYSEFLNAYIDGVSNTDINKYLSTRLNNLMKKLVIKYSSKTNNISDEDLYFYLIDSYLKDIDDNIPKELAKEELTKSYYNLLKKRKYALNVSEDLEKSVNNCLKYKVGIINKKYIDEFVKVKQPIKK